MPMTNIGLLLSCRVKPATGPIIYVSCMATAG
ncbi:MAG: hypothetical protein FD153_237 [Rhodospirillaceae bacterium]|nr:MAG: hypothetical protein FD153_237 [Rhodospirillaceae bacterium]